MYRRCTKDVTSPVQAAERCIKMYRDVQKMYRRCNIFGTSWYILVHLWYIFGTSLYISIHLGTSLYIFSTSSVHLRYIFGTSLVHLWYIFDTSLHIGRAKFEPPRDVPKMYQRCTKDVTSLYISIHLYTSLVHLWYIFGTSLVHLYFIHLSNRDRFV